MEPIQRAFATRWPESETVDLLDSSLSVDRAKDHDLTPRMFERFVELGAYAHRLGAEAILVTCSAFGPAIERMARELRFDSDLWLVEIENRAGDPRLEEPLLELPGLGVGHAARVDHLAAIGGQRHDQ